PSVCLVQAFECRALQRYGQCRSLGVTPSPLGQSLGLVDVCERHTRFPVRPNAFLQGRVVELALRLQNVLERPMLRLCGQKSESIGDDHRPKLPPCKLTR